LSNQSFRVWICQCGNDLFLSQRYKWLYDSPPVFLYSVNRCEWVFQFPYMVSLGSMNKWNNFVTKLFKFVPVHRSSVSFCSVVKFLPFTNKLEYTALRIQESCCYILLLYCLQSVWIMWCLKVLQSPRSYNYTEHLKMLNFKARKSNILTSVVRMSILFNRLCTL
jgi:hypothetical protein